VTWSVSLIYIAVVVDLSEGDRRVAIICLTLITSKPRQGCYVASGLSSLFRFFEVRIERAIGEVIGVEVGFEGLEMRHASRDDSGSVSSATELKVSLTTLCNCFCN
jgi:hypothetical protein